MKTYRAIIGEEGWKSPGEPPDDDRVIQIAWDDMSTSDKTIGFYDGVAEKPDSGRRFFWSFPSMIKHENYEIGAWREILPKGEDRKSVV